MTIPENCQMQPDRPGERGLALVIVMFMVMTMSLLGASLVFVSRTETLSSLNYQTVTQSRYAAESGISAATNYLLNSYAAPTTGGADDIAAYDITQSPVRLAGTNVAVVLSTTPADSTYPIQAVKDAFVANAAGPLTAGYGSTRYTASATLLNMRQMTDSLTGTLITLQTWHIIGTGTADGAGAASVQVSAILETNDKPVFQYAAFATGNGCGSLSFAGGAYTDSYDSSIAGSWNAPSASDGNVGTNGNLSEGNNSTINGSLSTPRSGVGNCSSGTVTAARASRRHPASSRRQSRCADDSRSGPHDTPDARRGASTTRRWEQSTSRSARETASQDPYCRSGETLRRSPRPPRPSRRGSPTDSRHVARTQRLGS